MDILTIAVMEEPFKDTHGARIMKEVLLGLGVLWGSIGWLLAENLGSGAVVKASSNRGDYAATHVVDGIVDDQSRWLASADDQRAWIEIVFPKKIDVGCFELYSGWNQEAGSALESARVLMKGGGRVLFDENVKFGEPCSRVVTEANGVDLIRLELPEGEPGRIREIAVYQDAEAMVGQGVEGKALALLPVDRTGHQIAVNQVGYDPRYAMRFTAPLSKDGAQFAIRKKSDGEIVYRGKIARGIGDFSALKEASGSEHYQVDVRGGDLKDGTSDPFLIQEGLYHQHFWQGAVDFLIDSRSVVGTHPSAYGGCPWRDGTYYDNMVPSLVLFYLANPERVKAMPRQIDWKAEKARVLGPNFKFDARNPNSDGVMDTVAAYYNLEAPNPDAPDVVKLIHWGAGYYLCNPKTRDPSGDPLGWKIHSQTLEQVSYVVWAWPKLKEWLPQSFYEKCLNLCLEHWENSGAFEVPRLWSMKTYQKDVGGKSRNPMGGSLHPYKGRHAPGHSIVPNLLMYEVSKRDGLKNPKRFLKAAVEQAEWIVKELDWNDPRSTKGHRMSEHRTINNLVWLLQKYPTQSPPGLRGKIEDWARVAVKRSDNLWDFRRYDLDEHWTIPKLNDVGSPLGFPAIALSASWVVGDEKLKQRLQDLAVFSVDHVFGRNPRLAAAPSQPEKGFPEIERGWPKEYHRNVCARLELCRSSISASPGSEMYPFNPEGRFRHPEGWVNYGANWCLSLAYFDFDRESKSTPRF